MAKLKFGDKVQLVGIGVDSYKSNVLNGRDPLRFTSTVQVGDVGVVIKPGNVYDRPRVVFQTVHGTSDTVVVDEKDLMVESDESNIKVLENIAKLQETVKISSKKYSTLDRTIIYNENKLNIGCQNISKEDALEIANDIRTHFGVK